MKPISLLQSAAIPLYSDSEFAGSGAYFLNAALMNVSQVTALLFRVSRFTIDAEATWKIDKYVEGAWEEVEVSGTGGSTTESAKDYYSSELDLLSPPPYVNGVPAPYEEGMPWAVSSDSSGYVSAAQFASSSVMLIDSSGEVPKTNEEWFNMLRPSNKVKMTLFASQYVTEADGAEYQVSSGSYVFTGGGAPSVEIGSCEISMYGMTLTLPIYGKEGEAASMTVKAVEYWSYGGTVNTSTGEPIIS